MKEKTKRNLKIWELRKKGLSYRQLAKLFDINVRAVFDIVKRYKKLSTGGGLDKR